ncbi:hypothetical protein KI387_042570, partial [Taxus chinensis]
SIYEVFTPSPTSIADEKSHEEEKAGSCFNHESCSPNDEKEEVEDSLEADLEDVLDVFEYLYSKDTINVSLEDLVAKHGYVLDEVDDFEPIQVEKERHDTINMKKKYEVIQGSLEEKMSSHKEKISMVESRYIVDTITQAWFEAKKSMEFQRRYQDVDLSLKRRKGDAFIQ